MTELLTFLLVVFALSTTTVSVCVTLLVCGAAFYLTVLYLGRATNGY